MQVEQIETIYRAKKIDSEEYVEGFYFKQLEDITTHYIKAKDRNNIGLCDYEIDKSTLAIHFTNSNMEDAEGNKIFASLSSDGSGGDVLDCRIAKNCSEPTRLLPIKFTYPLRFTIGDYDINAYNSIKVTGIYTPKGD